MNQSLAQKVFVFVCLPLMLCLVILIFLSASLEHASRIARQEARARQVRGEAALIALHLDNAFNAVTLQQRRSIQSDAGPDEPYVRTITDAVGSVGRSLDELRALCREDNEQKKILEEHLYPAYNVLIQELVQAVRTPPEDPRPLWRHMRALKAGVVRVASVESRATNAKVDEQVRSIETARSYLQYAAVLLVFATVAWVISFARHIVGKLQSLKENTVRLAQQQPLLPRIAGSDELAQIDTAFHHMAEALAEYVRKEQAMVDNAQDIICKLDGNRKFLKINVACREILGYEPAEMEGQALSNFLESEEAAQSLEDVVKTGKSIRFELTMRRKDKTVAVLLWSAHWSQQDQAIFCVLHDITDRKRLEEAKQEFVAMVSHDLRAPLMSVEATLTLLCEGAYGSVTDTAYTRAKGAEKNCRSLVRMINQILDMEKLGAGEVIIQKTEILLRPVLFQAASMVSQLAEKKSIKIAISDDDNVIFADEDRIVQVLVNLLSNAIKYSPENETVRLNAQCSDKQVEIRVTDCGRGIPEVLRSAIFERFRQVSVTDSKELGGTGLGLAICKAVVQAHGGEIGVDSAEGKGSTFWFRLPQ